MYGSLGSCILNFYAASKTSKWYIQSFNIALCAVPVLRHRNRMGNSTSILKNHNLESFRKSAWSPIILQCIMLAHQASLKIQGSTLIEAINTDRKPCWRNESKYLWNVLMCPFVLHALNSIVVSHWHMKIIESSSLTVLLTHLSLSLIILKRCNHFSDTWFIILGFMLDQELISLNVRLCAPNFAQRLGTVSWIQRTQYYDR